MRSYCLNTTSFNCEEILFGLYKLNSETSSDGCLPTRTKQNHCKPSRSKVAQTEVSEQPKNVEILHRALEFTVPWTV